MAKKSKLKISKLELAWYILCGIVLTLGLIFLVFGLIGNYLPVPLYKNFVLRSEDAWLNGWSSLGYRYWGLVLIAGAVVVGAIVASTYARVGDRDSERAQRRAQRLAIEQEVVEVEATDK